jgi:hypothetical protein
MYITYLHASGFLGIVRARAIILDVHARKFIRHEIRECITELEPGTEPQSEIRLQHRFKNPLNAETKQRTNRTSGSP